MEAFLKAGGPNAPSSAHPTVSRIFAKLKVPRDPFTKFSKNVPAKRFVHKRRKLTPQEPQEPPFHPTLDSQHQHNTHPAAKQRSTSPIDAATREDPQVPGAKLYLFRDRPEIMEAAKLITETNYRMGRQLNRLSEKRKILDTEYSKLQESARHFTEVEGKALIADRSARDYILEKLNMDLESMRLNAYLAAHTTKQYTKMLRRSKQSSRGVARNVVEKQEVLNRWTEPLGGHVARARNQVEVENTAWSLETKNLERTRNQFFETIREHALRLSERNQNTTDQKLAILLEEKAVARREEIRKMALLEMAHGENKKLVSRRFNVTSKQRMTKRTYMKLLTTLAKFQRLMQRLETSTGVIGIDGVVKRWFERDEREKSLRVDQAKSEEYIKKCTEELEKMQQQLNQFQTYGSDTAYTKRASRAFEKVLATFEGRSKESQIVVNKSSALFQSKRLQLGLVAECLRSLCVRFKLDSQAKALSKQLDEVVGYTDQNGNKMLAKRLTKCLSALDRTICNMGRRILAGNEESFVADSQESYVAAESKARAMEAERIRVNVAELAPSTAPLPADAVSSAPPTDTTATTAPTSPTSPTATASPTAAASPTATTSPTAKSPRSPKSTTSSPPRSPSVVSSEPDVTKQHMQQEETFDTELARDADIVYGLKKKSKSTMSKLKQERSKQRAPHNKANAFSAVQQLPSNSNKLSLWDLPCPLGVNVRVPSKEFFFFYQQICSIFLQQMFV